MRRVIGSILILLAPILWVLSLPMDSGAEAIGMALFFGSPILLFAGLALMSRRPSAQEVAEHMVRKDLVGSAVLLGALAALVGVCVIAWKFVI